MVGYGNESRLFGLSPSIQVQFPIIQQTALNLMGSLTTSISTTPLSSSRPTYLSGKAMDQSELLSTVEGNAERMTFRDICTFRLMLATVYRDLSTAAEMIEALSAFPVWNPAVSRMHVRLAFTGLASFFILRKKSFVKTLSKELTKIIENSSSVAFEYFRSAVEKGSLNAYPVYTLLLAEKTPSKSLFDDAIRVCGRSGLKNFEAIGNESCAMYFLNEDGDPGMVDKDEDWASYYLGRAVLLYNEWQAFGKTVKIQQAYCDLLDMSGDLRDVKTDGKSLRGRRSHRENAAAKTQTIVFDDNDIKATTTRIEMKGNVAT
jgi:hypothetical protein